MGKEVVFQYVCDHGRKCVLFDGPGKRAAVLLSARPYLYRTVEAGLL